MIKSVAYSMTKLKQRIAIITPVYNDWDCLTDLSKSINDTIQKVDLDLLQLIIVNDNSTVDLQDHLLKDIPFSSSVINLAINVGHQRAIAIGLCYVKENFQDIDYVIIMDSDGEDLPEYIPQLCKKAQIEKKIVFAERKKRSESYYFKLGYFFYRIIFKLLTKQSIKFGNFSCIPYHIIPRVIANPDLWNHYSASIIKSKQRYTSVPTERGLRYKGRSKMNSQSLILHGLSSISIYTDVVITRTLIFTSFGLLAIFLAALSLIGIRMFTDLAIPGWTSTMLIVLINFAASLFSIILLLLLIQLNQRRQVLNSVETFFKSYIISVQKYE